jgi:hypothetical protein
VKPRARRTELIVASVPEFTIRTFSIEGMSSQMSRATSTSIDVGAPKDVESTAASLDGAFTTSASACPNSIGPHDPT